MNEILNKITGILDEDEEIVSSLQCSIRTFIYREILRPGIIVATNKKLLFYGFNLGDIEFIETFQYNNISSIEKKKGLLKESIIIYCNSESIKLTNILSENTSEFLGVIKDKVNIS